MATSTTTLLSEPDIVSEAREVQHSETEQRGVLRSVNPYNGETTKTYTEMTMDEVDAAIATAHDPYVNWRHVPFAQRATLLRRGAKLCSERLEDLAHVMAIEVGKRIAEGHEEIELCASIFDFYAGRGEQLLQPEQIETPAGDATLLGEPLDVELPLTSIAKRSTRYQTLVFEISVRARLA